ncbi:MAG TPA: shikimate dehydrogenase, partial [Pyrinomonadaceae bacterium]|nr:shikimate dehydrogenase [Pyrinomonadaceae bacterium]
ETREIDLNFRGFSVTNPHKQAVINYLDEIDDAARRIGAVNTIKIVDGKLHGFNTDAPGFIRPLKAKLGNINKARVAVVGAGGAARACIYALNNEGAEVAVFARDKQKADKLASAFHVVSSESQNGFSDFDIIVNATPLGTRGATENQTIANAEELKNVKLVYDLVYNPHETLLISEARLAGAETIGGFDMLIAQATRQFEIWTGLTAPMGEMAAAARRKLDEG